MAFGISIAAILLGVIVAALDHPFVGGSVILAGLSPIVAAFIYGRNKENK